MALSKTPHCLSPFLSVAQISKTRQLRTMALIAARWLGKSDLVSISAPCIYVLPSPYGLLLPDFFTHLPLARPRPTPGWQKRGTGWLLLDVKDHAASNEFVLSSILFPRILFSKDIHSFIHFSCQRHGDEPSKTSSLLLS